MAKPIADAEIDVDTAASLPQRVTAEIFGTFLLVGGVIGTALFSSSNTGILGVALAVGLAVQPPQEARTYRRPPSASGPRRAFHESAKVWIQAGGSVSRNRRRPEIL